MIVPVPSSAILESLRVRIGLASDDVSKDVEITAGYVASIQWMELYLDRYLVAGDYIEEIIHKEGFTLGLKGYPITTINSVSDPDQAQMTIKYHIDKDTGVMHFDGYSRSHRLLIDYTISDPVIGAMYFAMLYVFDYVYAGFNSSGSTAGNGEIKAITSDGARVEFDVGSSSSSGSGIDIVSSLPLSVVGVLNFYRRQWC